MYGITSKTAKFIAVTGLALGISAIALPAEAGDRHGRGHHSFGKSHGFHGGHKHRRAFKKHGHRKHSFKRHGHRKHGFKKHGFRFEKHGHHRKGFRHGHSKGHKNFHKHGRRYNHSYWRKHGHHGVTVYGWNSGGYRPAYRNYRLGASCHPVIGRGRDHFGRRAKFGGTMCYDHYGRGYVVAGSRYVIRYY